MVTALNRAVLKRVARILDICLSMQLLTYSIDVSALFAYIHEEPSFYFVHSYHVLCEDRGDVAATTPYESEFVLVEGYLERKK